MVQKRGLAKIISVLSPVDKIIISYALITALWIIVFSARIDHVGSLFMARFGIIGFIVLIAFWHHYRPSKVSDLVHHLYALLLLSYWYGETYALNHVLFTPFDDWFKYADQWIFGCQPSVEFSARFPERWISELLNFGYFSYFFMNLTTFMVVYIKKRAEAMKAVFLVITSFFLYYILFILFPVVGPQFWLPQTLRSVPEGYLFQKGVLLIQWMGEVPTGAFPSSHVGLTIIFLMITRKYSKKVFWFMFPVAIILMFATVYIKAHYVVDVFAGIITSVIIFNLAKKIYSIPFFHEENPNN
jgi:membrane-associated phospholipid phosphatase